MPIDFQPLSPKGPLLSLDGRPVHDQSRPLEQAEDWVAQQVAASAGVVAVLGLGLGHHLQALRRLRPGARLIVFEPWPEAARAFEALAPAELRDDQRLTRVDSLAGLKTALAQSLTYGPAWLEAAVLAPPAYVAAAPELAREIGEAVRRAGIRREANLKTIVERQGERLNNLRANFPMLLDLAEATAAADSLRDAAGVIVAAGPSLAKNVDVLAGCRDSLVVLAVGTVFKRLISQGILPDVVVMIESKDVSAQVAAEPALSRVLLAAASTGHPAHLNQPAGQTLVFHPQPWLAGLLGDWPAAPDGGNVASAAFTLALLWGLNPIILVGQDLAYSQGQFYVAGAESPGRGFDPEKLIRLPGSVEPEVWASSELVSYLSWYEEAAAYLARARPDLRLINATEGGARIEGFEHQPLAEAAAGLPGPNPAGRERLASALAGFKRDPELVRSRLAGLRREAARMAALVGDERISLDRLMDDLAQSPLASQALGHLVGRPPQDPDLRAKIRSELGRGLASLGGLAADLQARARAWLARAAEQRPA